MTLQALQASISELEDILMEENALLERRHPADFERFLVRKCIILRDLKRHRRGNMEIAGDPEFGEKMRHVRALIDKNHRLLVSRSDELQESNVVKGHFSGRKA